MSPNSRNAGCSILLVDDESTILGLYENLLADEGYQVRTATSRIEALEILKGFEPQILFLDCRMGGMSNALFKEAVEKIQASKLRTRLIGFSAFSEHSTFAHQMRSLFGEFIEKPNDIGKFLSLVENLCFGGK